MKTPVRFANAAAAKAGQLATDEQKRHGVILSLATFAILYFGIGFQLTLQSILIIPVANKYSADLWQSALALSVFHVAFAITYWVTPLTTRLGLRNVTVASGLLVTLGRISITLSPSLPFVYPASICAGIGTIFLHYNAIILLNYHYKYSETLSVAMGFALCGQPVAIMSTPLILYWLQRQVGWVGASVISGGSSFTLVFIALALKPHEESEAEAIPDLSSIVQTPRMRSRLQPAEDNAGNSASGAFIQKLTSTANPTVTTTVVCCTDNDNQNTSNQQHLHHNQEEEEEDLCDPDELKSTLESIKPPIVVSAYGVPPTDITVAPNLQSMLSAANFGSTRLAGVVKGSAEATIYEEDEDDDDVQGSIGSLNYDPKNHQHPSPSHFNASCNGVGGLTVGLGMEVGMGIAGIGSDCEDQRSRSDASIHKLVNYSEHTDNNEQDNVFISEQVSISHHQYPHNYSSPFNTRRINSNISISSSNSSSSISSHDDVTQTTVTTTPNANSSEKRPNVNGQRKHSPPVRKDSRSKSVGSCSQIECDLIPTSLSPKLLPTITTSASVTSKNITRTTTDAAGSFTQLQNGDIRVPSLGIYCVDETDSQHSLYEKKQHHSSTSGGSGGGGGMNYLTVSYDRIHGSQSSIHRSRSYEDSFIVSPSASHVQLDTLAVPTQMPSVKRVRSADDVQGRMNNYQKKAKGKNKQGGHAYNKGYNHSARRGTLAFVIKSSVLTAERRETLANIATKPFQSNRRDSVRAFSGVTVPEILVAATFRGMWIKASSINEIQAKKLEWLRKKNVKRERRAALKNPRIWVYGLITLLLRAAFAMILVYIPTKQLIINEHVITIGVFSTMFCLGFGALIGRVLLGVVADWEQCDRVYLNFFCCLLAGLISILRGSPLHLDRDREMLQRGLSLSVAFLSATSFLLYSVHLIHIIPGNQHEHITFILRIMDTFQALGYVIGPVIAGLLFSQQSPGRDDEWILSVTGLFLSVGAFLLVLVSKWLPPPPPSSPPDNMSEGGYCGIGSTMSMAGDDHTRHVTDDLNDHSKVQISLSGDSASVSPSATPPSSSGIFSRGTKRFHRSYNKDSNQKSDQQDNQ